jgi:sodium-dependent dicarboxylate transporter 2/3/5
VTVRPEVRRRIAVAAGLLLFFAVLWGVDPVPGQPAVGRTLAVAALMACYWLTEALPLGVTALLPVVLLPVLGIMNPAETAGEYMNDLIFLFVGGFLLAIAMQDWGLHRRIALRILLWIGHNASTLLFGFMVATWFISWWVNNTATTLMMLPIAMSLAVKLEERGGPDAARFTTAMLLAVAYAASIGGMATLIGTAPNLVFLRTYSGAFPGAPPVTFLNWMVMAVPVSTALLLLLFAWFRITALRRCALPIDRGLIRDEHRALGSMTFEERAVMGVFMVFVVLIVTRADASFGEITIRGWATRLGMGERLADGVVAVGMAVMLFVIPSRSRPGFVLDATALPRVPWDIVILFGGGFALAKAFQVSGLSEYLGVQLSGVAGAPPIVVLLVVCAGMCFLSELASNTALAQVTLPVLASMAVSTGIHPLFLMVPATLAASCGFMLPVATPPNAIVFGTRRVRAGDMARAGFVGDWIGIVVVTLLVYTWGRWVLGIDLSTPPEWMRDR